MWHRSKNLEERMLLEFYQEKELCISNTWLKRGEKRKMTLIDGENETEIDYLLIKKRTSAVFTKCEANPWGVSACFSGSRER